VHLLVRVVIYILEIMFIVGMIGSAVVILMTGVEDVETLFESEEPTPPASLPSV
jgi:hypothetical protein